MEIAKWLVFLNLVFTRIDLVTFSHSTISHLQTTTYYVLSSAATMDGMLH